MTQITINIENNSIIPHLKKILNAIEGVSIAKTTTRKTGLEEALEDVNAGRINKYNNVDELFEALNI